MTLGQEYIKELGCELEYEEAIKGSMEELKSLGIYYRSQVYDNDSIFNTPIYPANAELYDEFVDDMGFDTTEYFLFIAKRIEIENGEY